MTAKKQNKTYTEYRQAITDIAQAAAEAKRVPKAVAEAIGRAKALLSRSQGRQVKVTPEQIAEMLRLKAADESYAEIGRRLRLPVTTVQKAVKRAETEAAKTKPPPTT